MSPKIQKIAPQRFRNVSLTLRLTLHKGKKVMARKQIHAISYLRTSSSSNVGTDKDSDKRQRAAITAFAKANGFVVVDEFYDPITRLWRLVFPKKK